MVLKLNIPTFRLSPSKTLILVCCILTFLYLVELCLGVRTVIYVFSMFKNGQLSAGTYDDISWTIVVATLLLCVVTSITVSSISSYWASKNTSGVRSSIYYCCHILTGGILWRYVALFKRDSLESQKEEAMLLSNLKFFFTQTYTLPLVIIHVSLHEDPYELLYDLIMLMSTVVTLVLTCLIFDMYEPCGEYPYQTMALVPLLFEKYRKYETTVQPSEKTLQDDVPKANEEKYDIGNVPVRRTLVCIQSLCFTFGRIVALGILLKLAGVYAFTIIFLQFLLSALYLKFQATKLIPETLSKSKQLLRLVFFSYILIFEWQLYRDTATGYSLGSKIKHQIFYYTVATVESMFYLIVWVVTENQAIERHDNYLKEHYSIALVSCGCCCLVLSYGIQVGIALFKNGGCSVKLHQMLGIRKFNSKINNKVTCQEKPKINISSFVDQDEELKPKVTNLNNSVSSSPEARYGSYRDLKENINYNIESTKEQTLKVVAKTKSKAPVPVQKVSDTKQQQANHEDIQQTKKSSVESKKFLTVFKDITSTSNWFPGMSKKTTNVQADSKQEKASTKVTEFANTISTHIRKLATVDIKQILSKQGRAVPQKIEGPVIIPTIMAAYQDDGLDSEYLKTICAPYNGIYENPHYKKAIDEIPVTDDSKIDADTDYSVDKSEWIPTRLYPPQVSIDCESDEDDIIYESSVVDDGTMVTPQTDLVEDDENKEQFV